MLSKQRIRKGSFFMVTGKCDFVLIFRLRVKEDKIKNKVQSLQQQKFQWPKVPSNFLHS